MYPPSAPRDFHSSPGLSLVVRYLYYCDIASIVSIIVKTYPVSKYPSPITEHLDFLSAERPFPVKYGFRLPPCVSAVPGNLPAYLCRTLQITPLWHSSTCYLYRIYKPYFPFRCQEKRWILLGSLLVVRYDHGNAPLTLSRFKPGNRNTDICVSLIRSRKPAAKHVPVR